MRPTLKILLICIALCSAVASAQNTAQGDLPAIQSEIRSLLETRGMVIEGEKLLAGDIARKTYEENDFKPFWSDTGNIRELILIIDKAPEHGLTPEDYNMPSVISLPTRPCASCSKPILCRAILIWWHLPALTTRASRAGCNATANWPRRAAHH